MSHPSIQRHLVVIGGLGELAGNDLCDKLAKKHNQGVTLMFDTGLVSSLSVSALASYISTIPRP